MSDHTHRCQNKKKQTSPLLGHIVDILFIKADCFITHVIMIKWMN